MCCTQIEAQKRLPQESQMANHHEPKAIHQLGNHLMGTEDHFSTDTDHSRSITLPML